jgi:mRNA interferase MazF
MPVTRGKVVLVPFPFDDLKTTKARPAVCLTDPVGPHRHIILAFITSQMPPGLLGSDLVIDVTDAGFARTGLRGASVVRLHRLMTVAESLIHRELGELSAALRGEVDARLRVLFGL